jgi:hypothetical protein
VAADSTVLPAAPTRSRVVRRQTPVHQTWLWSTVAVTAVSFAFAIERAPAPGVTPARGLTWLLFIGSSVHVASTGWLFTFPDVRSQTRSHRGRYLVAPAVLVATAAATATVLSARQLAVALLAYFGWQFLHYQKQNLGLVALAASSQRVTSPARAERRAVMATGWSGIVALIARPGLLQLDLAPHCRWYPAIPLALAAGTFAIAGVSGIVTLFRRPAAQRPSGYVAVYLLALGFPTPIFVFSSPYAAVGGMTLAHGLQYLLLVAMVATGPRDRRASATRLTVLATAALMGGAALNLASHLHTGGSIDRAVYGAYLGAVMAHFVVDAGLWRLRDPAPRAFLNSRVPGLLADSAPLVADASPD